MGTLTIWVAFGTIIILNYIQDISTREPGQGYYQELTYDQLKPGEALIFNVHTKSYSGSKCDEFSVRSINRASDGALVWSETQKITDVDFSQTGTTTVKINIPRLPKGEYFYRAELHFICPGASYVRSTQLFPFNVI